MEKHVKYCPICDKYHSSWATNCAFCNRKLKLAEEWDEADQNEKNYWLWYSEPVKDISEMNQDNVKEWQAKANAFDAQYRKELEEKEHPKYTPRCPTCGCPDIEKISGTSKVVDAVVWGFWSKKAGKTFRCKNCGYEW